MPKRAAIQKLVRQQVIAARGASVSEVYAPTAIVEANPVPPHIEADFVRQVNELLDRIRKTAVPAELRAEMKAYTQFYTDIVNLHNNIVDYLAANMYSPTAQLLKALLTLQRHAMEYRARIAKRATYLREPMPDLPQLKPIPGLILGAPRTGWRMTRL
jgi:cell division FtsZ-interacting protein ZapD